MEYKVDIYENQHVENIQNDKKKTINLKGGLALQTTALVAATGAKWRELNVPGEKEYMGRGVAFCPHCDGPFYQDKEIAVIGGGNSGVEAALDLAGICSKVTLIEFGPEIRADRVLLNKLESNPKIEIITEAQTKEVQGDGEKVTGLKYTDLKDQSDKVIPLSGVFIQIGLVPNSEWIKDHVETTKYGEVVINERTATSTEGIFAAGDVSTVPYKQIIVAMGEGAKAGLSAFEYYLKAE
jgi:alkyl hydroperoxide reductase subunit F